MGKEAATFASLAAVVPIIAKLLDSQPGKSYPKKTLCLEILPHTTPARCRGTEFPEPSAIFPTPADHPPSKRNSTGETFPGFGMAAELSQSKKFGR
jgi:hypothetical protein